MVFNILSSLFFKNFSGSFFLFPIPDGRKGPKYSGNCFLLYLLDGMGREKHENLSGNKKFKLGWGNANEVFHSGLKLETKKNSKGVSVGTWKSRSMDNARTKAIEKMNFWTSERVLNRQGMSSGWDSLENCHSMNFIKYLYRKNKPQYSCCYNGTRTNPMKLNAKLLNIWTGRRREIEGCKTLTKKEFILAIVMNQLGCLKSRSTSYATSLSTAWSWLPPSL